MFNRYAYVGDDPLNATDPTGEKTKEESPEDFFVETGFVFPLASGEAIDLSNRDMVAILTLRVGGPIIGNGSKVAGAGLLAKFSWQARSVASLAKTPSGLRRTSKQAIGKIKNVIENNLKPHDFKGVAKEMRGISTGFDHVTEMKQSLTAIQGARTSLAGSLKNKNLSNVQQKAIQNGIKRADQAIKRMEKVLN